MNARLAAGVLAYAFASALPVACGPSAADSTRSGALVAELARLAPPRRITPRLSIPVTYRRCDERLCGGNATASAPPPRILTLSARASRAVTGNVDLDALHTVALVDLLWSDEAGIALERSIRYLQAASTLSPERSDLFTDLAAAYLVRAERDDSPRDLLLALDAADRALELEATSAAARFNRALALDRLNVAEQAEKSWQTFLAVEPASAWAGEAKERIAEQAARGSVSPAPTPASTSAEIGAYVSHAPQAARELGWNEVLGQWGSAFIAGKRGLADSLLRFASTLGAALEAKRGDTTLADAVRSIRWCHGAELQAVARAHSDYMAGQAHYSAARVVEALSFFERSATGSRCSPTLRAWSRAFQASSLVNLLRWSESDRILTELVAQTDQARYPALAARARWSLGVAMLRRGRHGGVEHVRAAEKLFARIGERENVGALQYIDGETDYSVGNSMAAYRKLTTALGTLRGDRASVWRHNALMLLASAASKDGLLRAARYVQSEDIGVASRVTLPYYLIEARIARASLASVLGDSSLASADLAAARFEMQRVDTRDARRWFEARLRLVEAARTVAGDPARAVAALDSVILEPSIAENPVRLLPAVVARADALLRLGDVTRATSDVEHALDILDERRAEIAEVPLRAALLDAARDVVDRLVMLHLRSGDAPGALAVLERGRASFAPVTTATSPRSTRAIAVPPGEVAIEYALIGDTLLAWTVSKTEVQLARTAVDRSRLLRTIDEARASLELRTSGSSVNRSLSLLHEWLVTPVVSRLGGVDKRLVIVADGEIARVPFAALYDSARKSYLVESHVLRSAPSIADAHPASLPSRPRRIDALLVGSVADGESSSPASTRLPAARAEVESVAANYPRARVLDSRSTSEVTFVEALQHADVAHFAGHATFDDQRPERSYLEIGDARGSAGRLAAQRLSTLDLHRLRLMVLSACETMPGQSGRSGGFAGFTGALLAAGARGVVGSLWRVEDEATRDLMTAFHRSYAAAGDGPAALREAQLQLLHSAVEARQAPAAWAAFRYAGN